MGVDDSLDQIPVSQLRSLISENGRDPSEDALEFSDDEEAGEDAEDDEDEDEDATMNNSGYFGQDYDSEAIDDDDDDDDDDIEEDAALKAERFKTAKDLGFSDDEGDEENSDNDSDEEFTFRNALREVRNFKVKSKKRQQSHHDHQLNKQQQQQAGGAKKKGGLAALRRRIRRTEMDPEVKLVLSKANEAFVNNDLDSALKYYTEVIKMDKNNFSAYKTLGEIYRLKGDLNKCSNIWLLVAHINPWDVEFWKTVAELSVDLNHYKQAIYCYRRAINASNGKDYEAIFSRSCLYREVGKYKRATDGLIKLRAILPTESKIVRELAKVYVEENRINDSISLYTNILNDNIKYRKLVQRGEDVELENIFFDWSELNILCELYSTKAAWSIGIKTIRQVSRWIQFRENQTFWDDTPNLDIEFDDGKLDNPKYSKLNAEEKAKDYSLPIDIRVQLGIFRLNNKDEDEALSHFKHLLDHDIEEVPDLFYKVGMELESFALYAEALEFLVQLSYFEEHNTSELVLAVAKCLRETEDFANAKDAYIRLLKVDPDNVELMVALAECYFYLGDISSADKLYKDAKIQRKMEKATARDNLISTSISSQTGRNLKNEDMDYVDDEEDDDDDDDDELFKPQQAAIIEDDPERKRKRKKRPIFTNEELKTMEVKSEMRVLKQYQRCMRIFGKIEQYGNDGQRMKNPEVRTMVSVWIEMASDLIEIFSMYRWFFSSERAKKFNIKLRQRTTKLSIDHKLSRMRYLQNEVTLSQQFYNVPHPENEFKGLNYDQWYDLFINYSLMIAEFEQDSEGAIVIQDITKQINVFKGKNLTTQLVGLSIAILANDESLILSQSRTFMNDYQFALDSFRLYLSSCAPSLIMEESFADPPSQKFLLRQIKSFDSLMNGQGNEVTAGKANVTNTNIDISKDHFFTNYVYASYLFTNRSYYSALVYLIKLYQNYNKNPQLLFLLSLSHLYRSVQRKTLNTNFQILQGLTYMNEYIQTKDLSDPYNQMESYYNLGRCFNMLGLDSIAIELYKRVLEIKVEDPRFDLKWEAAHNLYTIYNLNLSFELAEQVMNEYLVI